MFLRKLTVILLPLGMLLVLCLLVPLFVSWKWYFGGLAVGIVLGILLALLLPLSGATKYREPFAWLLFIPSVIVLLILLYQYLTSLPDGIVVPVLRLFDLTSLKDPGAQGLIVVAESAFAAYMLTFSIRTGRGI